MNLPAWTKVLLSSAFSSALLSVVFCGTPTAAFAQAPPVNSIRATAAIDIPFDEPSGNAAIKVAGGAQSFQAVLQNGAGRAASPFWNQPGKQALILDSAKKQFVELRDVPNLDRPDAVSLSFFFLNLHEPNDDAAHGIVAKRAADARGTNYGINYHPKSDLFQVYVNDGRGFKIAAYRTGAVIGSRRLVHLTATFEVGDAPGADADTERDDVLVRLFVNGRAVPPANVSGGAAIGNDAWITDLYVPGLLNDAPLTIGSSTPEIEHTSGLIDEFLLFTRAVSESEASLLFLEVAGSNGRDLARRELELARMARPVAPAITAVSPSGLQTGATTRLTIQGTNLTNTPRVEMPVAGVQQNVVEGSNATQLIVDVSIPADAATGYVPLNVVSAGGTSNSSAVVIDSLPQRPIAEVSAEKPAALPGAYVGTVTGSEQARVYFHGTAGQTIGIEVETRRLGAALDPVLEVKSSANTPLLIEWGRANLRGDARTEFSVPADGLYAVELHDLAYNAPGQNPFRLRIGAPDAIDREPPKLTPVSTGVEISETRPSPNEPQLVDAKFAEQKHIPAFITGAISSPREEDRYLLDVTPGQTLSLSLVTRSINSSLDGELVVLKHPEGTMLAGSEERPDNVDPGLDFAIPADMKQVLIAVRDLHHAGGPRHRYRVKIVPPGQPDFRLSLPVERLNIPENGTVQAELQLDRVNYGGPIQLKVDGDESIVIAPTQIPADGANRRVFVTLTRSGKSAVGVLDRLRIVGESEGLTPPIRRTATLARGEETRIPGYADALPMGITGAIPVKLDVKDLPPALLKGLDTTIKLSGAAEGDAASQIVQLALLSTEAERRVDPNNPNAGKKPRVDAIAGQSQAAGTAEGQLAVTVPLDVAEGAIDFVVRGQMVPHAYSKNVLGTVYSKPFRLPVRNAVSINFDTTTFNIPAGAEGRVKGKITRTTPFAGPVDLALGGLPEGYKVAGANIPANKDEFELVVTSPAEKEAKTLPNLNLSVTTGGKPILNQGLELKVAPAEAKK